MVFINHTEIVDNNVAVVEVDGPLDSKSGPDFEDYINQLLEKNIRFILLDGARLEYISSEGIGLILFLQKKIAEGNGFFVIFNLSVEVMTLNRILGIDKVFRIAGSRAEALQIMDRQIELRKSGRVEEQEQTVPEPIVDGMSDRKGESSTVEISSAVQPGHVKCSSCNATVRIDKEGDYLCPECSSIISIAGSSGEKKNLQQDAGPALDFKPFVVECENCKSLIRIKKSGNFKCPDCSVRFTVSQDQTVIF